MTTPWEHINEEYRTYLEETGLSKEDFNAATPAERMSWRKQQQQQQPQPNETDSMNELVAGMNALNTKMDDMATVSMGMSEATLNFTESLIRDGGLRMLVEPICADSIDPVMEKYQWGENEHEDEGQPGCQVIITRELLPLDLDGTALGLFDVRNRSLPEVHEGKRKSNGFSDIALGDHESMSQSQNIDLMFSYTVALVELKRGKSPLKPGQLLLQLISLSQTANNRKGVVVLGTDCATKWRLVFFSKYDQITVRPYKCGKKCLQDLRGLVAASVANGNMFVAPACMPSIDEEGSAVEEGPNGEESSSFGVTNLRKLAFQLGKLYPDEKESLLSFVPANDPSPPPSMIYM